MSRELTSCRVYWDTSDPNNEGWAEKLEFNDGHEESGPCHLLDEDEGNDLAMKEAVVWLAWQYDVEIEAGMVTVDGLVASWER